MDTWKMDMMWSYLKLTEWTWNTRKKDVLLYEKKSLLAHLFLIGFRHLEDHRRKIRQIKTFWKVNKPWPSQFHEFFSLRKIRQITTFARWIDLDHHNFTNFCLLNLWVVTVVLKKSTSGSSSHFTAEAIIATRGVNKKVAGHFRQFETLHNFQFHTNVWTQRFFKPRC